MSSVTHLKFFDTSEFDKVSELQKRGWKIKPAGETKDGDTICAVYINEGDEQEIFKLHCPECLEIEIEVYHLDWVTLTCPNCGKDVDLDDWITAEDIAEIFTKEILNETDEGEEEPAP